MMPISEVHRAEWLADKIPAYGDYAKEAAELLRRYAKLLRAGGTQPEGTGVFCPECEVKYRCPICDRAADSPKTR